jgi:iron complex outermembrane receptor protein
MSEQWQHDFALAYNGRDITNKESLIDIPPLNLSNKIQFSKREWYDMKLELKRNRTASESVS